MDIEHYPAKAAREGSYGNRWDFHRCGTLAERWFGKETRKSPFQNRDWKGWEVTVSFQHLRHIIYLQVPFSRQSVKWERNDMEKDILHYQISCTRTLVVSHWPLCPVGPQPRIKVGSSCKSSSSSCDEKRFWKKPWRCQGHQGQDLHWTFVFFQMDVAPVRPACFLVSGISFIQATAFGKVTGHDF